MNVLGIVGWSGSGKTTLLVTLIPRLRAAGLRVSTIKVTHHDVDLDRPGKDSFRHRTAGATEVVLASPRRWTLMHESDRDGGYTLDGVLTRLSPVDLVLIEGARRYDCDKLEVHRPALGRPLLCRENARVIAVVSDEAVADVRLPVLPLDEPEAVARFILARYGQPMGGARR